MKSVGDSISDPFAAQVNCYQDYVTDLNEEIGVLVSLLTSTVQQEQELSKTLRQQNKIPSTYNVGTQSSLQTQQPEVQNKCSNVGTQSSFENQQPKIQNISS